MNDICKNTGVYLRNSLTGHFFDEHLAKAIHIIFTKHSIKSAYDLGCGHGKYTEYLKNQGYSCSGFDGNPYTKNITNGLCDVLNLTNPTKLQQADCVLCLEVGEHIPNEFEHIILDNIKNNSSKLIILSWAIEGQIGEGHVNCRNNDYIKNKFESFGFVNLLEDELFLRNQSSLSWFKNTIMVFIK